MITGENQGKTSTELAKPIENYIQEPSQDLSTHIDLQLTLLALDNDNQLYGFSAEGVRVYATHDNPITRQLFQDRLRQRLQIVSKPNLINQAMELINLYQNSLANNRPTEFVSELTTQVLERVPAGTSIPISTEAVARNPLAQLQILKSALPALARNVPGSAIDSLVVAQVDNAGQLVISGRTLRQIMLNVSYENPQLGFELYEKYPLILVPQADDELLFLEQLAQRAGPELARFLLDKISDYEEDPLKPKTNTSVFEVGLAKCVAETSETAAIAEGVQPVFTNIIDQLTQLVSVPYFDRKADYHELRTALTVQLKALLPAGLATTPPENVPQVIADLTDLISESGVARCLTEYHWFFVQIDRPDLAYSPDFPVKTVSELLSEKYGVGEIWSQSRNAFSALDGYLSLIQTHPDSSEVPLTRQAVLDSFSDTAFKERYRISHFLSRLGPLLEKTLAIPDLELVVTICVQSWLVDSGSTQLRLFLTQLSTTAPQVLEQIYQQINATAPSSVGWLESLHSDTRSVDTDQQQRLVTGAFSVLSESNDYREVDKTLKTLTELLANLKEQALETASEQIAEFLLETFIPRITRSGFVFENGNRYGDTQYSVATQVTQVLQHMSPDYLLSVLPQFIAIYDSSIFDQRQAEQSEYLNLSVMLSGIPSSKLLPHLITINQALYTVKSTHHAYEDLMPTQYVTRAVAEVLFTCMESDPQGTLPVLKQLEGLQREHEGQHGKLLRTLMATALSAAYQDTPELATLRTKAQTENELDSTKHALELSVFYEILLAYIPTTQQSKVLASAHKVMDFLVMIHQDERFPAAKKTENLVEFLRSHQEQLAKLFLLCANTPHSAQLIMETVKSHGFERLEERLELMDSFSLSDVFECDTQLLYLPLDQVNQGFIFNLIALHHAMFDPKINARTAWYEIMAEQLPGPELLKKLSHALLTNLALSVGIPAENVANLTFDNWDYKHLPRLAEAARKFQDDRDGFLVMFQLILKATFRGEFAALIDPNQPLPNAELYSQKELDFITHIKESNRLTRERFASRGLDIEAFHRGAERRLQGKATASEQIRSAHSEVDTNIRELVSDIEKFSQDIPSLTKVLDTTLRSLQQLTVSRDGSVTIDDVLAWHHQHREQPPTGQAEKTPSLKLSDTERRAIFETIKPVFFTSAGQWRPEFESFIRENLKFRKAFAFDREGVVNIKDASEVAAGITKLLSADQLDVLTAEEQASIASVLSKLGPPETKPLTPKQPNKPDFTPVLNELKSTLVQLEARLNLVWAELALENGSPDDPDRSHAPTAETTRKLAAIELQRTHTHNRINDVESLIKTVRDAREQDYDVTIRRWQRNPVTDLFVGVDLQCCVGIDSANGFSALQYLVDEGIEIMEVVDNQTGARVGGSFDFIGETKPTQNTSGTLSYHDDNIELNPSHQFIRQQVRDSLRDISLETAAAMNSNPEVGISVVYLGDTYNDVATKDLPLHRDTIRKLGGDNGFGLYLDTEIPENQVENEEEPIDFFRQPSAYHPVKMRILGELPGVRPPEALIDVTRFGPKTLYDFAELSPEDQARTQALIVQLENETFGLIATPAEDIAESLTKEGVVTKLLFDDQGTLIAYGMGTVSENEDGEREFYLRPIAVAYEFQGLRAEHLIRTQFEEAALAAGCTVMIEETMADTGRAEQAVRAALRINSLLVPAPVYHEDGRADLTATLKGADLREIEGNRTQLLVKTQLQ